MNERETQASAKIGLRELTEEDINEISEEAYDIVQKFLNTRIPINEINTYDIIIEINNSQDDLQIDIDIILSLPPRFKVDEKEVIQATLEDSFAELDKLLKEKYTS